MRYASAVAFRTALEARLLAEAQREQLRSCACGS